jgi:peptidoglycan/xylan/chitin deacetylase (PgdA/CDA1 family)
MSVTRSASGPLATALAVLAAGRLAGHVGPAATWLPAVRRLTPGLAGRGDAGHVAITFDDGPSPRRTPRFLAALDQLDVRATFFVLGEQLARHRRVVELTVEAGHEIAVHGWRHGYLLGRSLRRVEAELERTASLVAEVSGQWPRWFRPPYGVLTGEGALAARRLGMRPVLWTAWARDWTRSATKLSIVDTVRPGITGGATLLLHDAGPSGPSAWGDATLAALPQIVGEVRRAGLVPGPLCEHGVR